MPRKTKLLTSTEQSNVIAVLMAGADLATAADYVGRTPEETRYTGERKAEFRAGLESAEPKFELVQLGNITKAALREQYWRAAAWLLERKFPSRYAKPDPAAMSPAKVKTLLDSLAKAVLAEVADTETQVKIMDRLRQLLATVEAAEKQG